MLPNLSLRWKLIAACVLVQVAATGLVLVGSTRLMQRTQGEQATQQAAEVILLLDQALAAPLAQRDYATVQQTLDLLRRPQAITYLVLCDYRGKVIAASGWDTSQPLPARDVAGDIDVDRADATLHLAAPIVVSGQKVAQLDLGLSTQPLRTARDEFRRNALFIAGFALALSAALMAVIALAITRHLAKLSQASARVAAGEFDVEVLVTSKDEVGRLAESFNAMAATIKHRVEALERSEQQQRLHLKTARDEKMRLSTLLSALRSGILFVDANNDVVYANSTFTDLWTLSGPITGHPLSAIVPVLSVKTMSDDALHLEAMLTVGTDRLFPDRELRTVDGKLVLQRMQRVDAGPDGGGGRIWLHEDITLDRQLQQRARQAVRDALTDLLNRRGLYESLRLAIAQAQESQSSVALMFIDLDDFKHANDVGGHHVGDEILVAVANALSGQLRQGEIVARLGGDEFAVLSSGSSLEEAGAIAQRLVLAVSSLRFAANGQSLRVGCSIGLALYPVDAQTPDQLMACADTAMYQAKQGGKNNWCPFRMDAGGSSAEPARMNWNEQIHRALRDKRFRLHFQPVVRTADLRVVYHEAFLRMVDERDPSRLISPAQFVPHAERSGKIRQIDHWVFESCVQQLAALNESVCISANLSARSLDDASFVSFLRDGLASRGVDPRRLHIELTETAEIGDLAAIGPMIAALRSIGCAVFLDDFGTGYNSLSLLRMLEIDAIKIDGSFIRDLASDAANQLIVASLIKMAHGLNKTTVAKCVEDQPTLEVLRQLGIDQVQGFHLGRPAERIVDSRDPPRLAVVSEFRRSNFGGAA